MISSGVSTNLPDAFALAIPPYAPISLIAEQLEEEFERQTLPDLSHASVNGYFFSISQCFPVYCVLGGIYTSLLTHSTTSDRDTYEAHVFP